MCYVGLKIDSFCQEKNYFFKLLAKFKQILPVTFDVFLMGHAILTEYKGLVYETLWMIFVVVVKNILFYCFSLVLD